MQRPLAIGNPRRKTLLVQLMQPRKILSLILPGSNRHKKVGAQQTGPPGDLNPNLFSVVKCSGHLQVANPSFNPLRIFAGPAPLKLTANGLRLSHNFTVTVLTSV